MPNDVLCETVTTDKGDDGSWWTLTPESLKGFGVNVLEFRVKEEEFCDMFCVFDFIDVNVDSIAFSTFEEFNVLLWDIIGSDSDRSALLQEVIREPEEENTRIEK